MSSETDVGSEIEGWPSVALMLTFLVSWVVGMVLAKGFWSTLIAIILPPWGWYLIAERALQMAGWI